MPSDKPSWNEKGSIRGGTVKGVDKNTKVKNSVITHMEGGGGSVPGRVSTVDCEGGGGAGGGGGVGGHARVVPGVVLTHPLDAQHGVEGVHVGDGQTLRVGAAGGEGVAVPQPRQGQRLVPARHSARQSQPFIRHHSLPWAELRYLWGDWGSGTP